MLRIVNDLEQKKQQLNLYVSPAIVERLSEPAARFKRSGRTEVAVEIIQRYMEQWVNLQLHTVRADPWRVGCFIFTPNNFPLDIRSRLF